MYILVSVPNGFGYVITTRTVSCITGKHLMGGYLVHVRFCTQNMYIHLVLSSHIISICIQQAVVSELALPCFQPMREPFQPQTSLPCVWYRLVKFKYFFAQVTFFCAFEYGMIVRTWKSACDVWFLHTIWFSKDFCARWCSYTLFISLHILFAYFIS